MRIGEVSGLLRERFAQMFRGSELCSITACSYLPSNSVRIAVLRAWGARVGAGCAVHHGLAVRAARRVSIGGDCWIDEGVRLDGRGGLSIGGHVSIGSEVQIWTAQHDWRSPDFAYTAAPVRIGDRAWVNTRSIILPGVVIGEGAVVAAGAVVTKDVAPWALVAGVPARVVGTRARDLAYNLDARRNKAWWW